jgi:cyclophilin family peptidyl-prolyl cis-trans isomerase
MTERLRTGETARPGRPAAVVKTATRLLAGLALLVLIPVGSLPQRLDHKSAPPRRARAALLNPHDKFWGETAPAVFRVKFETSKGDFVVEVRREWAPRGAGRFYNLVRAGFFDDSRFFRVRAGFIAQFGIPGDPAVASVWQSQTIRDDPVRQSNTRGFVSYAMTGHDARTTQLFINLADNSRLDREGFAPVGRVVEGMEVVDQFYAGYGEDAGGGMRGGKQGKIFAGGNAYLDREFPKLDRLRRASVLKEGRRH